MHQSKNMIASLKKVASAKLYSLEDAVDLVKEIKPNKTILTNLHSSLDYNKLKKKLPRSIIPAYDGMKLIIN